MNSSGKSENSRNKSTRLCRGRAGGTKWSFDIAVIYDSTCKVILSFAQDSVVCVTAVSFRLWISCPPWSILTGPLGARSLGQAPSAGRVVLDSVLQGCGAAPMVWPARRTVAGGGMGHHDFPVDHNCVSSRRGH